MLYRLVNSLDISLFPYVVLSPVYLLDRQLSSYVCSFLDLLICPAAFPKAFFSFCLPLPIFAYLWGVSGSWLSFLGVASLGLGEFGLRRFEDCVSLVSYLDRKVGKRHAGNY